MIPLAQRGGPGGDQFVRPFADEGVLFAQRVGDARRRGGGVEIRLRLDAFFQQQTAAARRTYGGAAVRVGCEIFPAPGAGDGDHAHEKNTPVTFALAKKTDAPPFYLL